MDISCIFNDSLLASRKICDRSPDYDLSTKWHNMAEKCDSMFSTLLFDILTKIRFCCIYHVYWKLKIRFLLISLLYFMTDILQMLLSMFR